MEDRYEELLRNIVFDTMEKPKKPPQRIRRAYEILEYNCITSLTDEDMKPFQVNYILSQIDYALDTKNEEMFMEYTSRLEKLK